MVDISTHKKFKSKHVHQKMTIHNIGSKNSLLFEQYFRRNSVLCNNRSSRWSI